MQRPVKSHIVAILVTALIIVGLPRLPAVLGLGLPSWFSSLWLLLAILVLLAHLQRAQIFRLRTRSLAVRAKQKRSRSEM